jgi:hypothetical protein
VDEPHHYIFSSARDYAGNEGVDRGGFVVGADRRRRIRDPHIWVVRIGDPSGESRIFGLSGSEKAEQRSAYLGCQDRMPVGISDTDLGNDWISDPVFVEGGSEKADQRSAYLGSQDLRSLRLVGISDTD